MSKTEMLYLFLMVVLGFTLFQSTDKTRLSNRALASCISQIDSITATRQVQILEVDSMIVLIKRPYVEPDN